MILILALLVIVGVLGMAAAWLGENPGSVTMLWSGYEVETSVAMLVLLAVIAGVALTLAYHVLRNLLLAPTHYAQRRNLRQYRLGLSEVTHSVAALAASDIEAAAKHTRKAERALGVTPLTLLLRAQISKNADNDEASRALLEQLLEYPETEYLAAKSLADAAERQDRLPQALTFAERAHRVNPKASTGAWTVFELHLNAGRLDEAAQHARHARKTHAFSRADFKAATGRIALRQAEQSMANGHLQNALALAKAALQSLPGDSRAAELATQLLIDNGQPKAALDVIRSQWKIAPSAALAASFHRATSDMKPAKKENLAEKLVASNGAAAENVLLD